MSSENLDRARRNADDFLQKAEAFKLGHLETEKQHPKTQELSDWARNDVPTALATIQQIDVEVLHTAAEKAGEIAALGEDIRRTRRDGGRIFFSGCGATGRLSLTLEYLWREQVAAAMRREDGSEAAPYVEAEAEAVVAFMAGGDLALVKAIEDFEDHPEYGARQLNELGFRDGDLLVAITEGGETPFVIGTLEEAARRSHRSPYFLYCNPDKVLRGTVERSRRALENSHTHNLNLTTGPQVLSGSTRMQASTIQMYAAGLALFKGERPEALSEAARRFADYFAAMDLGFLEKFIVKEAAIYEAGEFVTYETSDYGMCVVTDTTERAPTFSLAPFENFEDADPTPSWAYLSIPGTDGAEQAWRSLLGREPRPLEWEGIEHVAGKRRLLGYDFSERAPHLRKEVSGAEPLHTFRIFRRGNALRLEFEELEHEIDVSGLSRLDEYTLLKILLNTHSTLVMGRLARYEGNVMLWVRPSNYKLIDRAARYVSALLERDGHSDVSYEDVVRELFRQNERVRPDESTVWETYRALGGTRG